MGPAKRARPSFSPPRPGKAKSKKTAGSKASNANKHKGRKGTREALLSSEADNHDETMSNDDGESGEDRSRRHARAFIDDEAIADEDDNDDNDKPQSADGTPRGSRAHSAESPRSSSPDMILAEVINHPSRNDSVIPEKLVHKLLQYHLRDSEGIRISKDGREMVTKYIDTFLREAIMRSTFERREVEKASGGAGTGFLEVEDLEKAAVQLCLDF